MPRAGQSAADLVESTDRALYAAKRHGRNKVVAHGPMLVSVAAPEPLPAREPAPSLVA